MFRVFRAFCICFLLASVSAWADTFTLVTNQGQLGSTDSFNWSNLGPSGTTVGSTFSSSSTAGISINGTFGAAGSCIISVGPTPPGGCGWVPSPPVMNSGDSGVWTNNGNVGTGPIHLDFGSAFTGFGIAIQDDDVFPFTAFLKAYNGPTLLGGVQATSNSNGDAIFIGLQDLNGANVTGVTFGLVSCGSCQDTTDFAVTSAQLVTPEPSSILLLGSGVFGMGAAFRRRWIK